ncbi:hypothetical protein JNL27_16510 [bacterium]|nr:hypothetical protein [bacterium]
MKKITRKIKKQMFKGQFDPNSQSNYARKAAYLAKHDNDWGFNYPEPKPWKG